MICFIRGRKKSSKLRNSSCYWIMSLSKKPKTPTKMKMLDKKKHEVLNFFNAPSVLFLDIKKRFLRVFLVSLTKERPILNALKQMILDEIRQSNGIKSQKTIFVVSVFLTKKISVGKCLQKGFIPFTWNIKNIPSAHWSSTLYLKLSHIFSKSIVSSA